MMTMRASRTRNEAHEAACEINIAKDSSVGVRTPAENRKDNMQAEYWSRLNDQMVLCRVLWDEPATNSVMRVIVICSHPSRRN
jgi:hypothetical protein